jgi:dynein heavy chain
LDIFAKYSALWARDRDEELKEFLANDPRVSEFEAKIKFYENLSTDINSQSEFIPVGPLAIFTGKFDNHSLNKNSLFFSSSL